MSKNLHSQLTALVVTGLMSNTVAAVAGDSMGTGTWKDHTISPVTNPLFFEDPQINSEVRPIFMQHNIDKDFVTKGGDVRVYAAELRWAPTDRLAIIATKDGYIDFNPKTTLRHQEGWADIAGGLKYAVIDDKESQFILTPGLKITLPTGNQNVFQGYGSGEWDLFASAAKGFGDFHVTGSVGGRIPNNFAKNTAQAHYSLQLDYYTCQYFIPFVAGNAYTILSEGKKLGIKTEGYDLINFGSTGAEGRTQATVGVGFRSRLHQHVDLGFAWEKGVTTPHGIFDDRYTVDLIFRF